MNHTGKTAQVDSDLLVQEMISQLEATKNIAALPNSPIQDTSAEFADDGWPCWLDSLTPTTDFTGPLANGFFDLTSSFWQRGIQIGIKSLLKRNPTQLIDYGIDSLLGWIFSSGEKKEDPTLKAINDINNKLDQISCQLNTIMNKLDQIIDAIEAQKYRGDIAQASTIRDPLQEEINLINVRLANAKQDKELRKSIIEDINTSVVCGNSFYKQTMAMGDTIIRTMNQSQKDIFHIAEAFTVAQHFVWDHQDHTLYTSIISYYMGTYLQAMAYAKLAILHQLELHKNDPKEYNNYISMFDILFSGNAQAGIMSNTQKVDKALENAPHNRELKEHPHYSCYKPYKMYVLRNTTFLLDSTLNELKPVSKAGIEEVLREVEGAHKAVGYIFKHFTYLSKIGFQIDIGDWFTYWPSYVLQLLKSRKKLGVSRDQYFGEMLGLTITKNSRYQNFDQIVGVATVVYNRDSCTVKFSEWRADDDKMKVLPSGSLTLKSSKSGSAYFDTYTVSDDLRPLILVTEIKPKD